LHSFNPTIPLTISLHDRHKEPSMMRRPSIFLVILTAACAAQDASHGDVASSDSLARGPRPAAQTIARAVDSLATRVIAEGLTPALGVAIVMDGSTILSKSYGTADVTHRVPADGRTLWYIASTSKSLTGFGVALLAHQRIIDLHAPITALLPRAQWPRGFDASKLTLQNFLAHTHQLGDRVIVTAAAFTGEFPESQWPAMLRYATPLRGNQLTYSNLGYNVAAMVIDAKRSEGWRRYLDSAVYRPAGMTETYARIFGLDARRFAKPHELRADGRYQTAPFYKIDATMNSAGGHLATLHDLARWVTVQMDSGVIDGKRVFPAEAVALSHRMIAPQTREERKRFAFFDRAGWASGWDIGTYHGEPMVSRFGSYSSTRSHLSFLPRRRMGVVTQTNGGLGSPVTDIIAAFAYDLEVGNPNARALAAERVRNVEARLQSEVGEVAESDATRAARQKPLQRALPDFVGSYRNERYGTVTIELRANQLHYRWGALHGVAEVLDARRNSLRIDAGDSGTSLSFDFPRSGPATSLELREETFRRQ
jgi:CubicO group peptidase (beta-lactamase class C family)